MDDTSLSPTRHGTDYGRGRVGGRDQGKDNSPRRPVSASTRNGSASLPRLQSALTTRSPESGVTLNS